MAPTYEDLREHFLSLLQDRNHSHESGRDEEIRTTPLFSLAVKYAVEKPQTSETVTPTDSTTDSDISDSSPDAFSSSSGDEADPEPEALLPQYGLLGFNVGSKHTAHTCHQDKSSDSSEDTKVTDGAHGQTNSAFKESKIADPLSNDEHHEQISDNEPILMNTRAPCSAFICGSQGSGKSYTLSCMLENCLLPDPMVGNLVNPVAGLVFHYDIDSATSVAEAASLCSRGIDIRVLVSTSNRTVLETKYKKLRGAKGKLEVQPLLLQSGHLTVERILKLMACSDQEGKVPLYMISLQRILREMAVNSRGGPFNYQTFKYQIMNQGFTSDQANPLKLRLELLESFMDLASTRTADTFSLKPGTLTIIDLSDPFVDSATACLLFDISLSIAKQKRPDSGLIVALDEAHKFMNDSPAASTFTERLLTTIREQRHNATRVVIATQEPAISEKLLDLCSVSIVHRFTSPAWFTAIKGHLGGASAMLDHKQQQADMFESILNLHVGESLVFTPSSYLCVRGGKAQKLGSGMLKMKTRLRRGLDSGRSVLTDRKAAE